MTVLLVTHDAEIATRAGWVVTFRDGRIAGSWNNKAWPPPHW